MTPLIYRGIDYQGSQSSLSGISEKIGGKYRGQTWKKPYIPLSHCRLCKHYEPQGRRGGICHQLNVPVQGNWKSCSLVVSPFSEISLKDFRLEVHLETPQELEKDQALEPSLN